jgi:kumamolisin
VGASGPVAAVERAFGITLELHANGDDLTAPQSTHMGRRGPIHLPPRVVGVVRAVAGLDECTRLRPFVQHTPANRDAMTADNLQSAWGPRQGLSGADVCIAVTAPAGGLDAAQLGAAGLPADVAVLGGDSGSVPVASGDWANATVAQVHAVRVVAPAARVIVHLGAGGERGAVEVLSAAIHDAANAPKVVLAGWGAPEAEWSRQAMVALEQRFLIAASMGVTVVCASPCDAAMFPATAPHALACAPGPVAGGAFGSMAVSGLFPGPAWQQAVSGGDGAADVAARIVPDVTAPSAVSLSGTAGSAHGAAISAALCAGLTAALAQAAGAPVGLLAPLLAHRRNSLLEPDVSSLLDLVTQVPVVPATTSPHAGSRAHPGAIQARRARH